MPGKDKAKDDDLTKKKTGSDREFGAPTYQVEGTKSSNDVEKPEEEKDPGEKPESVRGEDVLEILRAKGMKI